MPSQTPDQVDQPRHAPADTKRILRVLRRLASAAASPVVRGCLEETIADILHLACEETGNFHKAQTLVVQQEMKAEAD